MVLVQEIWELSEVLVSSLMLLLFKVLKVWIIFTVLG